MSVEGKIARLYRERQIALRRLFASKLLSRQERRKFSVKLRSGDQDLTSEEKSRIIEANLQEQLTPAPRTLSDLVLWFRGRSLDDIDRDLKSIPAPIIEVSDRPFGTFGSASSHFALFWCYNLAPGRKDVSPYQCGWNSYRAAFPPGLIEHWVRGKPTSDPSAVCEMKLSGGPRRSRLDIRERQNHDGFMVGYGGEMPQFGRHFCLEIGLSKPMWGALSTILSVDVKDRPQSKEIRHILAVPVPQPLTPRPLAVGSSEPFLETISLPLPDIGVLSVLGSGSDWLPFRESYLRELV